MRGNHMETSLKDQRGRMEAERQSALGVPPKKVGSQLEVFKGEYKHAYLAAKITHVSVHFPMPNVTGMLLRGAMTFFNRLGEEVTLTVEDAREENRVRRMRLIKDYISSTSAESVKYRRNELLRSLVLERNFEIKAAYEEARKENAIPELEDPVRDYASVFDGRIERTRQLLIKKFL